MSNSSGMLTLSAGLAALGVGPVFGGNDAEEAESFIAFWEAEGSSSRHGERGIW